MTPNESEIEDIIRCSREPLGEGDPSMVLHSENRLRAILIAHHQVEAAAHARGREEGLEEAAKVVETLPDVDRFGSGDREEPPLRSDYAAAIRALKPSDT